MELQYNGGYYLIKTKPIQYGEDIDKTVITCSACINISAFDRWCFRWRNDQPDEEEMHLLGLTTEKIEAIRDWTDCNFDFGATILPDLETAKEFKSVFFESNHDIDIYSLSFAQSDAELLLEDKAEFNDESFGLRLHLLRRLEERDNSNEEILGYDFIGIEEDGSLHTFYCHNITKTLVDKFGLKINANGLFEAPEARTEITAYLNDPAAPVETLPWIIAKVKRHVI